MIPAVAAAGCVGYILCPLLAGLNHGFIEFGAVLITMFLVTKLVGGSLKVAFLLTSIGYAFAWVGHFHYGKNIVHIRCKNVLCFYYWLESLFCGWLLFDDSSRLTGFICYPLCCFYVFLNVNRT